MNLTQLAAALAKAATPPARWCRAHRVHRVNPERSAEWNAWRERQALHPTERHAPIGRSKPTRSQTAAEQKARRASTRATRRREHRAASLAMREAQR